MSELYGTEPIYHLEFELEPGEWRRDSLGECSKEYGLGYVDACSLWRPSHGVRLVRVAYPGDSGTVIASSTVLS